MTSTALTRVDGATGEVVTTAPAFALTDYLAAISSPAALEAQRQLMTAYDRAVEALVGPGDLQDTGDGKQFKKKSAWCKLGRHFGISTRVVRDSITTDTDGEVMAVVVVRASAPWGQTTEGLGACSTREKRFEKQSAKAKADHDCLATAATRARNRAISDLIAQGEVSAEEVEHMGGGSGAAAGAGPVASRQASAHAPTTGPVPPCPKCGGAMWDNRVGKTNPKAPDFKCKNAPKVRGGPGCDGAVWPPKAAAPNGASRAQVAPVSGPVTGTVSDLSDEEMDRLAAAQDARAQGGR